METIADRKYRTAEQLIHSAVDDMAGGNRFDKLVELRDEAQRLIVAERDIERARTQDQLDKLQKELAAKKERLGSLGAVAANPERRKRSDAGKPRSKPDTRSVAAISRGDLAQVS